MRIFFPGLLLFVSLIVFVICAGILVLEVPRAYEFYYVDGPGWKPLPGQRDSALLQVLVLNSGVLVLVTWAATWAWKEIRREKMGRID